MATPQQLREEVAVVTAAAVADLSDLLVGVPDELARDLIIDVLPGLVTLWQDAAAEVAAEWYEEFRDQLEVPGSFVPTLPDLGDPGIPALVNWAEKESQDALARLSLIEGGVTLRVANGARATVIDSVNNDPRGIGFQRYSRQTVTGCGFCQALASRGTVYRDVDSASFGAHDRCRCVAVPAFGGAPIPVKPYTPTAKNVTDADRARTRAWLARKGL